MKGKGAGGWAGSRYLDGSDLGALDERAERQAGSARLVYAAQLPVLQCATRATPGNNNNKLIIALPWLSRLQVGARQW